MNKFLLTSYPDKLYLEKNELKTCNATSVFQLNKTGTGPMSNWTLPSTHFMSLVSFYSPCEHQKTRNCVMFPAGIEWDRWDENGYEIYYKCVVSRLLVYLNSIIIQIVLPAIIIYIAVSPRLSFPLLKGIFQTVTCETGVRQLIFV